MFTLYAIQKAYISKTIKSPGWFAQWLEIFLSLSYQDQNKIICIKQYFKAVSAHSVMPNIMQLQNKHNFHSWKAKHNAHSLLCSIQTGNTAAYFTTLGCCNNILQCQ